MEGGTPRWREGHHSGGRGTMVEGGAPQQGGAPQGREEHHMTILGSEEPRGVMSLCVVQ